MIYSIFSDKDNTIYEFTNNVSSETMNTGLDSILELEKVIFYNTNFNIPYNSRILIKFDISDVLNIIGSASFNAKYYLNLYSSKMQAIPLNYTIMAHPISGCWDMGTGNKSDVPFVTNGSSWYYRDNGISKTFWGTGSLSTDVVGNYIDAFNAYVGGVWYSGSSYDCSQSFSNNETTDLRIDVTKIVKLWLNNSIANEGFIIKKSDLLEQSIDYYSSFTYFSQDTNTIYLPKLEVCWDDSLFSTGSLLPVVNDEISIYFKNLKKDYQQGSKAKIRLVARDIYPEKNYVTNGLQYKTVKYLPTSSYYSIRDAATDDIIVPFDKNATKISCDSEGNYFNIWFNSMQPERFYRFIIKIEIDEQEIYFDNNYIFKVRR